MISKLMLSVACVLAIVGSSIAEDQLRLLEDPGFSKDTATLGKSTGDSATVSQGDCQATWTRIDSERVDCVYELPDSLPATVPGGGSVYTIQGSSETNGIFDGTVTPACQGLWVQTVTDAGDPSLLDALRLDCTGTAGGSSDNRPLCFDGSASLKRC
ncbi:hypothetical protein B0O99DRAFT_333048 [Bisporella sp. PMI_857]|nr:hypothetical protein B0O99DRAFT_333048 [Bisporella sp. PMI_857]